jgi:hypothetical protein
MFLPCRPCCEICLSGCPAKTNTLRITVSSSDYEFTILVDEGYSSPYTRKTLKFLWPGSAWSGTFDLTSSDGILYRNIVGQCSVSRFDARIGGVSNLCRMEVIAYSPMNITAGGSSAGCSAYTYLCQNNQPSGQATNPYLPEKLFCGSAYGGKDMASCFSLNASDWSQVVNIAAAADAYADSSTQSYLYSGGTSILFGTYLGLSRFPVGSYTETGDATLTITDATFV